jgi:hypothetical protein
LEDERLLLGSEHVRHLQGRVDALSASRAAAVEAEAHSFQRLERDLQQDHLSLATVHS